MVNKEAKIEILKSFKFDFEKKELLLRISKLSSENRKLENDKSELESLLAASYDEIENVEEALCEIADKY